MLKIQLLTIFFSRILKRQPQSNKLQAYRSSSSTFFFFLFSLEKINCRFTRNSAILTFENYSSLPLDISVPANWKYESVNASERKKPSFFSFTLSLKLHTTLKPFSRFIYSVLCTKIDWFSSAHCAPYEVIIDKSNCV